MIPGSAMHPLTVPTDHTLAFILDHLPPKDPRRILEVGAGDGRLARALQDAGHHVTAIDLDRRCVAEARQRGVDAHFANWLEYPPTSAEHEDSEATAAPPAPFDAVLFSRSLHHIAPLDTAVARAVAPAILVPGGRIIVEDFSFAAMDRATLRWLATTLRTLTEAREILPKRDSLPAKLVVARHPASTIARHRKTHHTNPIDAIRRTIERHATIEHESDAPYLYRYVADAAVRPPPPKHVTHAGELVEQILATEQRLIRSGQIRPIGRRIVARARA